MAHYDANTAGTDGGLTIADAAAWVWSRRFFIAACAGATLIIGVALALFGTPIYTAQVSLLPRTEASGNALLGQFASLSGISFGGEESFDRLYARIVTSDRIIQPLLDRTWAHNGFAEPATLAEIFDTDTEDPRRSADDVGRELRDRVSFFRDARTGYMILSVHVPRDPQFAADLANALVSELEAFDRDYRRSRAAAHRELIEARLAAAESDLDAASRTLTEFVTENRTYAASPALMQTYGELNREVAAQEAVWIELRKQLELAKVNQGDEVPSFTILDRAKPPIRKTSPRLVGNAVLGLVVGICVAFLVLLVLELRIQVRNRLGRPAGGTGA